MFVISFCHCRHDVWYFWTAICIAKVSQDAYNHFSDRKSGRNRFYLVFSHSFSFTFSSYTHLSGECKAKYISHKFFVKQKLARAIITSLHWIYFVNILSLLSGFPTIYTGHLYRYIYLECQLIDLIFYFISILI